MAEYPKTIDFFSEKVDQFTDCRAIDINDVQDTLIKVQETLGVYPQGQNQPIGWTVADRLDAIINANGTLKGTALTSSDIPSRSITNTKIYHNDTFEFKEVKVGMNNAIYGYTGNSSTPGVTISGAGELRSDSTIATSGNFIVGGGIIPDRSSLKDIGTSNLRFRFGYIDTVVGQSTGTENLSVLNNAYLCNTLNIKASGDLSTGDTVAFAATDQQGNLVIQGGLSKDINIQPYGGNISFGASNSRINEDVYNFNVKYPYVADEIQEQIIANPGQITSVSAVLTTSASGATSAFIIDIVNDGQKVLDASSNENTFTNVTTQITTRSNIIFGQTIVANKIIALNIKQVGSEITGDGLKVQIKIRRT